MKAPYKYVHGNSGNPYSCHSKSLISARQNDNKLHKYGASGHSHSGPTLQSVYLRTYRTYIHTAYRHPEWFVICLAQSCVQNSFMV